MKGKAESETVEKTEKIPEEKRDIKEKEVKKEEPRKVLCENCKWLDTRTIRKFKRDGIKKGLIENRGKCLGHVHAKGHLVRIDMPKVCAGFEKGKFVVPKKKDTKKKTMTKEEIKEKNPKLSNVVEVLDASLKERQRRASKTAKQIVKFAKGFDVSIRQSEIHKVIADQLQLEKPDLNNRVAIAIHSYLSDKYNVVAELADIQKIVNKGLKISNKSLSQRKNGDLVILEKRNGKTFVVNT